ncbi:hypothetical protein H4219_005507 [Mycoemilia scoparia]|uniref:WLM domain-containing protein n=1 Tax=Mycoemilia scoparia TaxID=417184 RepID=A0A9W8DJQ7_9FUNG|nr:hypothetical protein H4219_005507 [Mycoemilia scoparia]
MSGIGKAYIAKDLPNPEKAEKILNRIIEEIEPTLQRFNWYIGTFSEFYPEYDNLLGQNINNGEMIQVRFRYPRDPHGFLRYNMIMDTVLHERLAHNTINGHEQDFNELYKRLRELHGAHRFQAEDYDDESPALNSSSNSNGHSYILEDDYGSTGSDNSSGYESQTTICSTLEDYSNDDSDDDNDDDNDNDNDNDSDKMDIEEDYN